METVVIPNILETDWCHLRDQLIGNGWMIRRGGGLDHAWADLQKADLRILMEYDRWDEGKIEFPAARQSDIRAELPGDFLLSYAKD